jgi:putative addiction module component (TIGR02574 family)
MSATEIIEQMRSLPAEQKRQVVEQIWTEFGDELGWVDPDLTPEQAAELDRRLAEFEKNPREGISWEQVQIRRG